MLPEGTYILCGRVTEAGTFPLAAAGVEILGGPDSGRTVLTDLDGSYLDGVSGVSEIRASKDGYVTATTQTGSSNTELVNIALTATLPCTSRPGRRLHADLQGIPARASSRMT